MGKIYAKVVVDGSRTLASAPSMWYAATVAALELFAADGKITEARLAEILSE